MKQINLLIALTGIVVLLALGLLLVQADRPKALPPKRIGSKVFEDFKAESVKAIDLKKNATTVRIEKKNNDWLMTSHKDRPVKKERLDALFGDVREALVNSTRTSKPEVFKLDAANRAEITFQTDAKPLTFYVGQCDDPGVAFVQVGDDPEVLEIDRGLESSVGLRTENTDRILAPPYFYDLRVLTVGQDEVIALETEKDGKITRLQKLIDGKDPVTPKQELPKDAKVAWWIVEPEKALADERAVEGFIANASITAKDYADKLTEAERGFDKPTGRAKLTLKDGATVELTFGKIDGDDVVLGISGKPDPFKIYKYIYDSLTRGVADLKKKEETPAAGDAPPGPQKTVDLIPQPAAPAPPAPPLAPITPPVVKTDVPPPPPAPKANELKPADPPAVLPKTEAKELEKK